VSAALGELTCSERPCPSANPSQEKLWKTKKQDLIKRLGAVQVGVKVDDVAELVPNCIIPIVLIEVLGVVTEALPRSKKDLAVPAFHADVGRAMAIQVSPLVYPAVGFPAHSSEVSLLIL
jgi:hypothetical protein